MLKKNNKLCLLSLFFSVLFIHNSWTQYCPLLCLLWENPINYIPSDGCGSKYKKSISPGFELTHNKCWEVCWPTYHLFVSLSCRHLALVLWMTLFWMHNTSKFNCGSFIRCQNRSNNGPLLCNKSMCRKVILSYLLCVLLLFLFSNK